MSENFTFNAGIRERVGKGASRLARREGTIPASLYGDNKEALPININPKELLTQLHRKDLYSAIFNISVNGSEKEDVLIRDIQFHPVKDTPLHVDFLRIGENTITRIDIPVVLINEVKCPGIKLGGTLNFIAHSLEVACNPKYAPQKIEIDLATAVVGTVVKIEDINLPENVKTYYPKGYPIYSITAPSGESNTAKEDGTATTE